MNNLNDLREAIIADGIDSPVEMATRLSWYDSPDGLVIEFFGHPFMFGFGELLTMVGGLSYSERVRALLIRGPDEGANGTRNWDMTPLIASGNAFPKLEVLSIEQTAPGNHNNSIVGANYDEEGILAAILAQAPRLARLTSPSAPSAQFFQVGTRPLSCISVDTGYDHQEFILNLARSTCFPSLKSFEFGEPNSEGVDSTPYEHYEELFRSESFANVTRLVWRNPKLEPRQVNTLAEIRKNTQVLVVNWSQQYQRHQ